MRIRPGGAELLSAARLTLRERIVPALPHDRLERIASIERAMAVGEERLGHPHVAASEAELNALEDARLAMRDTILHALPAGRRYDARLVAKAIAIARSQLSNGNAGEAREAERLAALLGVPAAALDRPDEVGCTLAALNAQLAARIRSGAADAGSPAHAATLAHLEAITREALSESNPSYHRLPSSGGAAPRDTSKKTPLPPGRANAAVAWSDVSRFWWADVALSFRFGGIAELVFASCIAAFATQAVVAGYLAQRAAANPNDPMVVVESAHQLHDLSVAFAELSVALFALAPAPRSSAASNVRARAATSASAT